MMPQNAVIGIISQINWGDPLCARVGLLELAFSEVERRDAKTKALVIAGGLISWKYYREQYQRLRTDDERDDFCLVIAKELSEIIPRLPDVEGCTSKIYVMTSPTPTRDGPIGAQVATLLTDLRSDIRYYPQRCERIPFDGVKDPRRLAILVCSKSLFSSDYQSTPLDNVLKQELKRSSKPRAQFYVIAGVGVYVHKPPGSRPEYVGVPALHRLQDVTTENQVGMVLLDITDDAIRPTNISFKDYIANERSYVPIPSGLPPIARSIYLKLREEGLPLGQLADILGEDKATVLDHVQALTHRRWEKYPQIRFNIANRMVDFEPDWLKYQLRYPAIPDQLDKDRFVVLACLHAGARELEYEFVLERLVEVILETNPDALAIVGDLIQGLRHDLEHHGEVIPDTLYTEHEEMAGILVARVLGSVLRVRLANHLAKSKKRSRRFSHQEVKALLLTHMQKCFYAEGNHDQWVESLGFRTLAHFDLKLRSELHLRVEEILAEFGLPYLSKRAMTEILNVKAVATHPLDWKVQLESKNDAGFAHPHKGGAKTTTVRLEEVMNETLGDCNIIYVGNFHSAVATAIWTPERGQRVGFQLSTMLNRTKFERNISKKVYRSFGVVETESCDGRIVRFSTRFINSPHTTPEKQEGYWNEIKSRLGKY